MGPSIQNIIDCMLTFIPHLFKIYLQCEGESMQPTINEGRNGDIILVEFISVSCMRLTRYVIIMNSNHELLYKLIESRG